MVRRDCRQREHHETEYEPERFERQTDARPVAPAGERGQGVVGARALRVAARRSRRNDFGLQWLRVVQHFGDQRFVERGARRAALRAADHFGPALVPRRRATPLARR
jgi:hypothetical protein